MVFEGGAEDELGAGIGEADYASYKDTGRGKYDFAGGGPQDEDGEDELEGDSAEDEPQVHLLSADGEEPGEKYHNRESEQADDTFHKGTLSVKSTLIKHRPKSVDMARIIC